MRLANVDGRTAAVSDGRYVDLETATDGEVPADPMLALLVLERLGDRIEVPADAPRLDPATLGPPVPRPQKILGAGINYQSHAEEADIPVPGAPSLFAKLPNALCGAYDDIRLGRGRRTIDWEAEVVVVIGRRGKDISESDAWSYIAGVTAGQDISDRDEQFRDLAQFTIGKSYDTYAPIGPVLVTPDELADRDDIGLSCVLNGEQVQTGRTSECIFSVPVLVSWISRACTLEVGDLIFTGTPPGVGYTRKPAWFLADGDVLETNVEGVGSMRNVCRNGTAAT